MCQVFVHSKCARTGKKCKNRTWKLKSDVMPSVDAFVLYALPSRVSLGKNTRSCVEFRLTSHCKVHFPFPSFPSLGFPFNHHGNIEPACREDVFKTLWHDTIFHFYEYGCSERSIARPPLCGTQRSVISLMVTPIYLTFPPPVVMGLEEHDCIPLISFTLVY